MERCLGWTGFWLEANVDERTNNKNPTARSLFSRTMSGNSGGGLEDSEDAGAPASSATAESK